MLPSPEVLSRLVGDLYAAADDPALWDQFLQQLAHTTGAQSAGLVMLDAGQDVFTISSSFNVDLEATRIYHSHYNSMDVWAQRGLAKPAGYVCESEALCPLAELAPTEIYNDFMIKFGIEHGLFGVVENSGPRWASVSLYRDSSLSAFESSELDILRFLAPHMQRAFELHLKFSALKNQSSGFLAALDLLPTGVVFLGRKGKVLLMNRGASALIAERDGLLATREGLRAERPAESALLEKTIRHAVSTLHGKGLSAGGAVMVSRRTRPPLKVQISPICDLHPTVGGVVASEPITAVAFVADPTQAIRPTQEILRALYGLTPAECRVAILLLDGQPPKEIAGTIGVTIDTVRSQIRSIFGKTGVNRQSDLIRLIMRNSGVTIREI